MDALPFALVLIVLFGFAMGACSAVTTVVARVAFAYRPRSRARVLLVVALAAGISMMGFYFLFWARSYPEAFPLWSVPVVGLATAYGAFVLAAQTVHEPGDGASKSAASVS
jgi:hypothetical protein